jgi:hypothetical protein
MYVNFKEKVSGKTDLSPPSPLLSHPFVTKLRH